MVGHRSKCSPNWTSAELLHLISIWGEEAVPSQLRLSHRNWDTYRHISRGLCEKGYDQDTLQCREKIKEPRQGYHKAREAHHCSSASPNSCRFCKELDAILGGDPTSSAKSPVDTLERTTAAERGPNPEDELTDEEVELDEDMQLPAGSLDGAGSQELFSTPEVSSQSQQLFSGEQEAGDETPHVALRNTPRTPAECLCPLRKGPRHSKENMFPEVLQSSNAERRECKECWEAEWQDRKENHEFVKDVTERMIKGMEEQMQMLTSLMVLQMEQIQARPPLQHIQNSFPCPPTPPTHSFPPSGTSRFPLHSTHSDSFHYESWTYTQL
ncbi:Zinc finger and SCAN domain-containing protein 20 [Chelonia mydas]|uniref:Zinc finger and SCAN domain-containing protein 20 n=1 Tax=Chelonia mydas TaxID=8469 RepID=M7BCH3_CHEMY|nr:Zinc finger and SCAN domain-containing protein 20 [Chelonia mydas]